MALNEISTKSFHDILNKLVNLAEDDHYNPFEEFKWPETLSEDDLWMSKDLLSIHNTSQAEALDKAQIRQLSKWESVNFYSLNVHGIRELLIEVVRRIHTPGFELPSEFFHHFVGEENEHMWFFSKFCLKYGGKIYRNKKVEVPIQQFKDQYEIEHFLVFVRILIFEEIVDYYNVRMAKDESLNPIIRKINRIHHQDESRHIAFGRQIIKLLFKKIKETHDSETLQFVEQYIKKYMLNSIYSFYNPDVYKDAGLPNPYKFRKELIKDPRRTEYHKGLFKKIILFFENNEIFMEPGWIA